MLLGQQLQLAIAKSMYKSKAVANAAHNSNTGCLHVIRKEMLLFEDGGIRGKNLVQASSSLFIYLPNIPPSGVEAKRAFSSAGVMCTRILTRLSDGVLDDMLSMRS
jgi:hypothetical protein